MGPAFVLYLIADAAAVQGELDPAGAFVALVAAGLSLSRMFIGRNSELPGARAAAWLGLCSALVLVRVAAPSALSLAVDMVGVLALCGVTVSLLELALHAPDVVTKAGRRVRTGLVLAAALAASVALSAHAPVLEVLGRTVLVPARWSRAPWLLLSVALPLALWLRLRRRRAGSSPEALASNTWAVFALVPAVLAVPAGWLALGFGIDVTAAAPRVTLCLLAALLAWGHVRMVDPARRLSVGPTTRDAAAGIVTLLLVSGATVLSLPLWPRAPLPRLTVVVAGLMAAVVLYRALRELSRMVLAPYSGRLLMALRSGHDGLAATRSLEDLAAIALGALRRAAGDSSCEPLLHVCDPLEDLSIDAAGQARRGAGPLHPQLLAALRRSPGEVILRAPLEAQLVRNPPLRPLIEALVTLDALCVVPLTLDGELEGALIVPRGRRRGAPNLEEIEALHGFARHVAGYLAVLTAEMRARERAGGLLQARDQARRQVERLSADLARADADARALRAGGSMERLDAPAFGYGPAMATLRERLSAAAELDVPLLLVAERGVDVLPLCRQLHLASERAAAPFVLGACAEVAPEQGGTALFGDDASEQRGWLRLADGGVLVLTDLPALTPACQARLAAVLDPNASAQPAPLAGLPRLIATSRLEPEGLVDAGALDAALHARFPTVLHVPPLRERREDLLSLMLLEIDRACRVLGRETVGIDGPAQEVLIGHSWPGNQIELRSVIERAVSRCSGTRITTADLPTLAGVGSVSVEADHPLDGSFEAIEQRVLAHALERSDGNKSEAARLLGLKRTTFLDKLRRHGLDDGTRTRTSMPPPN